MNKVMVVIKIVLCVMLYAFLSNAQMKNSVYSMFGIGELVNNEVGVNKSLGGTGIAFQSGRSINYLNPASYIGLLPNSIIIELGVYGISGRSQDRHFSITGRDINLSYFSANLYIADGWGLSAGIVPFSHVDYKIITEDKINGSLLSYEKEFTGRGGLSRLYLGNSFKVYKGLNAGLNISYIVGSITNTEIALQSDDFTGYELKSEYSVSDIHLDYGLQYIIDINDWSYIVGLTYGANNNLNKISSLVITYNGTTDSLKQTEKSDIIIPQKLGLGVSVKHGDNFRVGFDYEWNEWSRLKSLNGSLKIRNSNKFSFGIEYAPAENKQDEALLKSFLYRLGVNYKRTYLEIAKTRINSYGINFGVGIPFQKLSTFNICVEYGEEGTFKKGLIKNSYWMFYLNVSLQELWVKVSEEE